jgi:hypothetical protein
LEEGFLALRGAGAEGLAAKWPVIQHIRRENHRSAVIESALLCS